MHLSQVLGYGNALFIKHTFCNASIFLQHVIFLFKFELLTYFVAPIQYTIFLINLINILIHWKWEKRKVSIYRI